ncbi:MAG: hypothetical protein KC684_08735 [Candidatus Omnitrophica bacterium]|nr:hypothetical protein [Candidatus Omnitrophota bacterium]
MKELFKKFKAKWGIKSNWDFFLINLVFALAGACIGFERRPVFHFLGITHETSLWIKVCVYIPLIVPLYQLNLLIFGFVLGQFPFFWEKEKKMGRSLLKLFGIRKRTA